MSSLNNRRFYNSGARHPLTDYRNKESTRSHESIKPLLASVVCPDMRVLDLGCNSGRQSFILETMGAEVVGVDFADEALVVAREIAEEIGSKCRFVESDVLDMPFDEGSFDLAVFNKIIIEFSYQGVETLCEQLKRMLVPGGLFCIIMYDGLRRLLSQSSPVDDYDPTNGIKVDVMDFEDTGKQVYETYFWTLAFAHHIIGRYFTLIKEEEYCSNNFWLVYKNDRDYKLC